MTITVRQAIANALQGGDKPEIGETCAEFAERMRHNLAAADHVISAVHLSGLFLCPRKPTAAMVEASMNTITWANADANYPKKAKHMARLQAALKVAMGENVKQ